MNRSFDRRSLVMELAPRQPFRLGSAIVDPVSREARWNGGEERLQPQTMKVLLVLAANRGELVTRDELVELCWDGRIVGDDVINRSISLLRHFAERAGGFSIETVPRAGYRLVEHVRHSAAARWPRRAVAGAGAALLAAVAVAIAYTLRPVAEEAATLRVAVEPFTHGAGDERSRRLAQQVQEASIRMLAESGVSVLQANEERVADLRADFVLSGAVTGSGKGSIATVKLDDPLRHAIVLSRRIEADPADPAALPEQVGAQLAASLSWVAPLINLDRARPSDPALIASLLNTNQTEFDSQRAFELARRTAPNAPNSPIAQLSLAMLTGMNLPQIPQAEQARALRAGRMAAARAQRLAPNFGDSYIPWCMLHAEVRLAECEAQLRNGLNADPEAPSVGNILANLLRNVGRIEEAVPVATQVHAANAYSPGKIAGLLVVLEASGRSAEAKALFSRGQRLWPRYNGLVYKRLAGITARGDLAAALALEAEVGAAGMPPDVPSAAALASAVRQGSLPQLRASCPDGVDTLTAIRCMHALAQLGDLDNSFALANRLYPRRTARTTAEEEAIWLANPDNLDTLYLTAAGAAPMRRDARFLALAERLGLVRYWRSNGLPDFCTRDHEPVCRQIAGRTRRLS